MCLSLGATDGNSREQSIMYAQLVCKMGLANLYGKSIIAHCCYHILVQYTVPCSGKPLLGQGVLEFSFSNVFFFFF